MKVLGIITARGGSKGIPGKNLKLLGGKPLLAHTVDAVADCALDRVILSTEDQRIAEVGRSLGVDVPFMVPKDRTILCIELSLWKDEPMWQWSDEDVYKLALRDLMKMGYGVTESEVDAYYVTDIPTAYPVYELNFEDHLIPVLEGVHSLDNVLTLGRHGAAGRAGGDAEAPFRR